MDKLNNALIVTGANTMRRECLKSVLADKDNGKPLTWGLVADIINESFVKIEKEYPYEETEKAFNTSNIHPVMAEIIDNALPYRHDILNNSIKLDIEMRDNNVG